MWHSLCLTVTEKFITWRLTLCIFFIKRKSEDERVTVAVITFRKFRPNIHGPREFFRTTKHWFDCISINIRFGFFVTRFYDSWIIHKDFNNFVESKIMKNRQFREIDIFGESTTTIRELWTTTLSDFLLFVPFQRPFQFSQTICPKSGYKMFYRLLTAPLIRDPWTVINPFYASQFFIAVFIILIYLGIISKRAASQCHTAVKPCQICPSVTRQCLADTVHQGEFTAQCYLSRLESQYGIEDIYIFEFYCS